MDPSRLGTPGGNPTPTPEPAAPAPSAASGAQAWLPLVLTLVAMPILAYATTTFILMPKLQQAIANPAASPPAAAANTSSSKSKDAHGGSRPRGSKERFSINKIIVNVAGTMGTRYLMSSITLVGTAPDFKSIIEDNKDLLLDLTNSTLKSKTISDLEKPGALNQIRTELMSVYNNALGSSLVHELYITEFAIQ